MTIKEIWDKCKGSWFLAAVLILTTLLAFGLGRLSKLEERFNFPVRIESAAPVSVGDKIGDKKEVDYNKTTQNNNGQVVGSKQGSKYHFPWCSGAKRIKADNLIIFNSAEKARAAGYEPAANCPGLK